MFNDTTAQKTNVYLIIIMINSNIFTQWHTTELDYSNYLITDYKWIRDKANTNILLVSGLWPHQIFVGISLIFKINGFKINLLLVFIIY